MILHPAFLMRPVNGVGSPNDSMIASGRASSATSSAAGLRSRAHRIKPIPTRALPASASSLRIAVVLAYPEPMKPSPPAWVTVAASLPPAAEPIGAKRIGCSMPSRRVSAVSMTGMSVLRIVPRCRISATYRPSWLRPGWSAGRGPRGQWNSLSASPDRHVVYASLTAAHQPRGIELPLLVAVRAIPVPGIVVPFVLEPHGDAVVGDRP